MMTTVKDNRLTRELDSRAAAARPTAWRPPELLPSPDARPGWKHHWVRTATLGQADAINIASKLREGYEPCKAEDYPEMLIHASTEGRFKGNIEYGGLLLCRIPEEFLAQRSDYYSKQNKSQMDSVDNNFLRNNDPRMPLYSEKKTQVSFGNGSK
jgi:hypothetical protein